MLRLLTCATLALLAGCAEPAVAPTARPTSPADLDGAVARWSTEQARTSTATRYERRTARERRREIRREARRRRRPRLPPRGRPMDVHFRHAPLANALTFLAEAAHLGLVIGEGVEGTVSVHLHHVRPVDAMRALAEANGVVLDFVGRTVVAHGAGL